MEGKNEPDTFAPGTPHGDRLIADYAKRLDSLLNDKQEIIDDIKELKNGAKVAFLNKAVMERRKRGTGPEAAIYDLRVQELQLYYRALGLEI